MKKYLLFVPVAAALFFCASCRMNTLHGEGNKTTTTPSVPAFNAVEVELPIKATINVQEGGQPGVTFSGYENVLKHLSAKVENNALHIETDLDETWSIDCEGISIVVTLPSLVALSLEGASDADIHGNITGSEFKLDISGAGKAVIDNINVDNFSGDLSGAASVHVNGGAVKHATYEISGAGKVVAFPLQAKETTASISGAGKGEVTALEKLTASISGAGTIKYKGHPAVTKDISGAGTLSEAN